MIFQPGVGGSGSLNVEFGQLNGIKNFEKAFSFVIYFDDDGDHCVVCGRGQGMTVGSVSAQLSGDGKQLYASGYIRYLVVG